MQRYREYANDEALALAASALDENSRKFWLNIAKAWAGLMMIGETNNSWFASRDRRST
jgi:hypothetical protein